MVAESKLLPIHQTSGMHFEWNGELVVMVKGSLVKTEHEVICSVGNDDILIEGVDATTLVNAKPGTLYG